MHGVATAPFRLDALVNLNHPNHFIEWGWLSISRSNAIVIGLMVVTFIAAVAVPFPGQGDADGEEAQ